MTDFLNLPNVTTTAVNEETDRYIVEAKAAEPKAQTCRLFCPVLKNGKRWREINDTPIHGKPVLIRYHVQRFTCSECGNGGLYEGQPFLQPGFWMTRRLLVHIAKQSMRRTFAEVARECFVDAKTASNAFRAYVDERVTALDRKTPRVLGIDEKMLLGAYRAVLGNIEQRTVLNMLPDRKAALEAYLADLPEKARVEVVVTDRYEDYRRIVRQKMPGRLHVTDRFHVTDKASAMLDKIRSDIAKRLSDGRQRARLRMAKNLFRSRWASIPEETRAELQRWFAEIPVLSDAYWAKEHYCDMYLCGSPAEAERYYRAWHRDLPESVADRFGPACTIPKAWLPMVFAYFEAPYTTGYVESINRFLDDLQRDGRGYSFDVMRAKLLLAEPLEKKTFRRRPGPIVMAHGLPEQRAAINLGIELSKLRDVFGEAQELFYQGRTVKLARGLSALQPVFDEAA